MKHFIIFFLLVFLPISGYADPVEIDGIYYNLVSKAKAAEVTRNPNYYSGSLVIPSSVTYGGTTYTVTSVSDKAFYFCSRLTSVTFSYGITSIGEYAFSNCSSLSSVIIPNSVTSLNNGVFEYCKSLTSVNIPNSVKSIGWYVFEGCTGLESVTIPGSVTSVGVRAFAGCTALVSVSISNGVKVLDTAVFKGCTSLSSIEIPNSVTYIDGYLFSGCTGLTSVTIGNSVTSIGNGTFEKCKNLVDVYCLAENVPSTNSDAFKESDPESITLHVPDKSIDAYKATEPWSKFKKIVDLSTPSDSEAGESYSGVEIDGVFYNLIGKNKTAEVTSNPNYYSGSLVIPSSVTYGGTTYTVTSVSDKAFYFCSRLTSVTFSYGITSIGEYAFSNCSSLSSVIIPNSVTSLNNGVFEYCKSLTSVNIPNSVKSIGWYVFEGCTGLESVTIPGSVTSVGVRAFAGCTALVSVSISNGVKVLDTAVFKGCTSLSSIEIPNSVTYIDGYLFSGCTGLTSVTIGNSVTSIGNGTFEKCKNLVDVYCLAENVPSTNSDAFEESYPEYITLHVPGKSVDAYNSKEPWSKFKEILALDGTALAKISISSEGVGTYCFDQDLDFSGVSGIEAYVVCGFNPGNGQALMMRIMDVPAGTGLFVKTATGKAGEFTVPTKKSYSYCLNMFKPVFAATTVPTMEDDYTNYVLTNGVFTKSNGSTQLPANSAYIQLPNKLSSNLSLALSFVDEVIPGDANNDGYVNVADIVAITNYRKGAAPAGFNAKAADLNNDSNVDETDISILDKMIMGK